jgi:hypothetical protein
MCTPNFSHVLIGKNETDSGLVNYLARIFVPALLSVTQCRQSRGNFGSVTKMGWGTIMFEQYVSSDIQQDSIQYLWQIVLKKMSVSSTIESVRQNLWAYKIVPNNTSPNVNGELLFVS